MTITNPASKRLTFFLYARKSSESEDRQVQSIDDQINRLKGLANSLDLEIKAVLTEAMSAKKPNCRPVFAKMLERIEKGEADGILCWEINRITRNPVDSGKISWMLQQNVLKCIQTMEKQYLPDDNVLLFNVESGMANQFIIDLRKNSRRGMEGKVERGWYPALAPLGYLNDRLENTIYPDPDRFALVRKMWSLMLTGTVPPTRIVKIANAEWGFRTPKRKRSGGHELSTSVIYKIFGNIFYTGSFQWAGQVHKGNHERMVSPEEYDRVQVLLGRKGRPRSKGHEFAYTGLMRCAECGSMYTATEKIKLIRGTGRLKKYVYYHCTRRKKGVVCSQRSPMTLKELEVQVEQLLERNTILPEFQRWALDVLNKQNDKEIAERTKIYESQHKTVVQTQRELDNLTRMRYREQIDDDTFAQERDLLQSKLTKLKDNLRHTEVRAEKWIELTEKTFNFAACARKAFAAGDLSTKREIFAALGRNFLVKGKILSLEANDWFVPIQAAYSPLKVEYSRLELNKNISVKAKQEAKTSLAIRWQARKESNLRRRFWRPT